MHNPSEESKQQPGLQKLVASQLVGVCLKLESQLPSNISHHLDGDAGKKEDLAESFNMFFAPAEHFVAQETIFAVLQTL